MIFTPDFKAEESNDGKKVIFTNTSNFDTNDQGYTRSSFTANKLVLKDAYGSPIDTIDFPISGASIDKISIPLNSSKWIDAELVLEGPASFSKLKKFAFYKIFIQKYKTVLRSYESGQATGKDVDLSTYFKDVAEYAIVPGDSVEFQENIDIAHSYLKQCL